jgi:hypothetical protein
VRDTRIRRAIGTIYNHVVHICPNAPNTSRQTVKVRKKKRDQPARLAVEWLFRFPTRLSVNQRDRKKNNSAATTTMPDPSRISLPLIPPGAGAPGITETPVVPPPDDRGGSSGFGKLISLVSAIAFSSCLI